MKTAAREQRWTRRVRRALGGWLDRHDVSESAVTLATAIIVGVLTGFSAVGFRRLIALIQYLGYESWRGVGDAAGSYSPWHLIIVPAVGGLIVGVLVFNFAREAKGHGVPEVMEAVALRGGRIRPVVAVVKALASSVCIGTGGAAGREGPIVQIGSALGSTVGQALRLSDERVTNLVACGAAGGIAATFNAPIAGAIFAMEVILGRLHTLYFGAVVVSAVIADVVAQSFDGNTRAFVVPEYGLNHPGELALYAVLGILAGVLSVAFSRGLYAMEDLWDALPVPEYVRPALGGVLLGVVGIFSFHTAGGMPRIFGVGYDTITDAALGNLALEVVFGLLLLKMLATSLTLGSGGSGGVFAPSLFMGAMLGSAFGQVVNSLFPAITAPSGAYALAGMSAFFAGAAHAPVTAILILFEMTGDYAIILPLMLATVMSTVVARILSGESIYTLKLARRGVRLEQGLDAEVLEGVRVAEVMTATANPVRLDAGLNNLNQAFTRAGERTLPVVDKAGRLAGVVSAQDLDRALARGSIKELTIGDIASLDAILVIHPEESIGEALRRLEVRGLTMLPVVDAGNPRRLLGSVTRDQIHQTYERGLSRRARQLQKAAEAGIEDDQEMNLIYVDVPADATIDGVNVRDLALPRECLIVSFERDGRRFVVHGDTRIRADDRVAVVVTQECTAIVRDLLTDVREDAAARGDDPDPNGMESNPPAGTGSE